MKSFLTCAVAIAIIGLWSNSAFASQKWYPLEVDVWDPPFNTELKRTTQTYIPLEKAEKPWKICVSIPHLKDVYWEAVNFALVDEARRLGISLRINEAGGYDRLDVQRQQIQDCMKTGAEALIVSGVTTDGVNDLVEGFIEEGRPVIDLINWISAKGLTARAAVTYWDNGFQAGTFLKEETGDKPTKIIWFPGPKGPGWSALGDQGLNDALKDSNIEILETGWGDTGRATQAELIEASLAKFPDVDYIIGTTVSAEAAIDILRKKGKARDINVLAYYYGPGVHRGIKRGHIKAAPTDKQGLQARLAVDQVVRALEGKPFLKHVGPKVEIIDRNSMKTFEETTSIPPRGFRPVFSVRDWNN